MKPSQNSNEAPLLVFGAHPDDIEFGCGGVVAIETRHGRAAHLVICSRGEAATNGNPEQRTAEGERGAAALGASVEFVELDGDAHLEVKVSHAIKLAEIIRRVRPSTVLAPTCVENQHPDHARVGQLVRNAARLARYGGVKELLGQESHSIDQLLFYAVTSDGEPKDDTPILVDISSDEIIHAWTEAMNAHLTQMQSRHYIDLQFARARVWGERAGVHYAMALYSNDPLVVNSLCEIGRGARNY